MKRSLTLLTSAVLLYAVPAIAQSYTEAFEGGLVPGCVTLYNSYTTTLSGEVIHGTGSLYSNPPVNNSSTRDYLSPYLNVTTVNLTVSFWYKLSQTLNGNAKRTIEIGLESSTGVYQSLNTLNIDDKTPNQQIPQFYSANIKAASTGIYRLVLKMGGDQGNGSVRVLLDDITINANPYYSTFCNAAPTAVNDFYVPLTVTAFSDNVITNSVGGSDNEPNGESMKAILLTAPAAADGTVVLNADGTFSFTPAPGFLGGPITFTYQLIDNGYAPASSNTATVTINYPSLIILPVSLISFEGNLSAKGVQLKWAVASNEAGKEFQILRSTDGKLFTEVGAVDISKSSGKEKYEFTDIKVLGEVVYYKIRMLNRDNSVSYSKVLLVKPVVAGSNRLIILKNPVESTLYFTYTSLTSSPFYATIYSTAGSKLLSKKLQIQTGTNLLSLELNELLLPGTYFFEITNGEEKQVVKLLKK